MYIYIFYLYFFVCMYLLHISMVKPHLECNVAESFWTFMIIHHSITIAALNLPCLVDPIFVLFQGPKQSNFSSLEQTWMGFGVSRRLQGRSGWHVDGIKGCELWYTLTLVWNKMRDERVPTRVCIICIYIYTWYMHLYNIYIYISINTIVTVETRCSQHCLLLVSRFKVVVSFR